MKNSDTYYWDGRFRRNAVKLLPGDYYANDGTEMIVTVLGSCVSACIQDRKFKIGGMNHFMLPMDASYSRSNHHVAITDDSAAARYGNVAMERLINEIIKLGGNRLNMQAKIFGGARITNAKIDIGEDNIEYVREYLDMEGINVVSEDVGGTLPRKVYYIPSTNEVFIKKIQWMNNDTIVSREEHYMETLQKKDTDGEVFFLDLNQ